MANLLLMAAQAAGLVGNVFQTRRERRHLRQAENILSDYEAQLAPYEAEFERQAALGTQQAERSYQNVEAGIGIEKGFLGLQMEQENLAFTEQSLLANEELRSVMSSQRAFMAARGQKAGQGSARAVETASLAAFNEDERARALSHNFRSLVLKGQHALYDVKSEANLINRNSNILNVQNNLLQNKANLATARTGIKQQKADLRLKHAQAGANLFQSIMGQVPFAEYSGIFLGKNGNLVGKTDLGRSVGGRQATGLSQETMGRLTRRR